MASATTRLHGGFLSSPLPSFINCRNKVDYGTIQVYPLLECKGQKSSQVLFDNRVTQILSTIQQLLQDIKLGHPVQSELDRYIIVYRLIQEKQPILNIDTIDHFVLQSQHVFDVDCLPDIGKDIRELFYPRKHKNLILYLIEYSLPYIKHNRLSLPSMNSINSNSVLDFSRIILGSLLGIFPHCKRKPTWPIRVQIYDFFHKMMTSKTIAHIYAFCDDNIPLLRISIIEYFVYFIQQNMPVESMLNETYVKDCSISMMHMYGNILFITDSFRQSCLQKDFCLQKINAAAVLAVERLNRLCKGKTGRNKKNHKENLRDFHNFFQKCTPQQITETINLPCIRHCSYTLQMQSNIKDLNQIMYAKMFQQNIVATSLPKNIVFEQFKAVENKLITKGSRVLQCMNLHVCFLCSCLKGPSNAIRFNEDERTVLCDVCKCSKYLIKINLVGRILKVFDTHYYFCHFCCKVHPWRHDGSEFICCSHQKPNTQVGKKRCIFCDKLQCETINVLDDRIGVMQPVHLCRWHMPYDHVIPYIHNLDSLWGHIKSKTSKKMKVRY